MQTRSLSITLPEDLLEQVEEARLSHHRSSSELIEDALRSYLGQELDGPLPGWQRGILQERLAAAKAEPGKGQSWEQVEAELWPR